MPAWRSTALVAALASLAIAGRVEAQDAGEDAELAREHFEHGVELYDRGDLAGALGAYRAAHAAMPRARIMLNIGLVLVELGRDPEAANALAAYLEAADADPTRRPKLTALLAELDGRVGRLALRAEVPGTLVVDDAEVGALTDARTWRVAPGSHEVELRLPAGAPPLRRSIDVSAGQAVEVAFEAPVIERPEPAPAPEPEPTGPVVASTVTAAEPPQVAIAAPTPSRSRARFAVFVRVDVDLAGRGAVTAPGAAVRLGPVEVFASGLFGSNLGAEAGLRLALGRWWLRPTLTVAAPVFFKDGARPGGRAALGVSVQLGSRLQLWLDVGGAYAPSVPDDVVEAVGLGSVGVATLF